MHSEAVNFMNCEVNSLCQITENSPNVNCSCASQIHVELNICWIFIFHTRGFLENLLKKIQVLVKSDKNSGYFATH